MSEELPHERKRILEELNSTGEKYKEADKTKEQEQDVECLDTKVWLWDGDSYEEFDSDYLNQIFPYKLNKKTMTKNSQFIFHFLSASMYYWIELIQQGQPEPQKLGKKDTKVIEDILKNDECDNWIAYRRWGEKFNKQQQFLKHQQQEKNYTHPKGETIHTYTRGDDHFSIVKYTGDNKQFHEFKQRLEVLLLFYIDGVSFVFEEVDTWIYYIIYKKGKEGEKQNFVGMLSKYVFRLSTVKERHRISQVFILPPYQKSGHGKELIDTVYEISLNDLKCFEITTEIPSFEYQCLRDFKQLELIIKSNTVDLSKTVPMKTKIEMDHNRGVLLTKQNVRKFKEELKIPGHQIERLVNILIYYKIQKQNDDMVKAHFEQSLREKIIINRSPFKTRRRLPHLTMYGQVPNLKQFMLEKAKEDLIRNQEEIIEILLETINGFNRVITKAIRAKLLE